MQFVELRFEFTSVKPDFSRLKLVELGLLALFVVLKKSPICLLVMCRNLVKSIVKRHSKVYFELRTILKKSTNSDCFRNWITSGG